MTSKALYTLMPDKTPGLWNCIITIAPDQALNDFDAGKTILLAKRFGQITAELDWYKKQGYEMKKI